MKKFMSVILAAVLVIAVGASFGGGIFARVIDTEVCGFIDTEVSTDNYMCAGTRNLEINGGGISGGPISITHAMPCKYYYTELTLSNAGDLDGVAFLHIPKVDGSAYNSRITWQGLKCLEDGTVLDKIWNGTAYVIGSPVNGGVASSEAELVAEEGGQVGQITVTGLGVDAGSSSGTPEWEMSKHIDIQIWFDKNGDGDYDDAGESINIGQPPVKLYNILCQKFELGVIPASTKVKINGGWGSYFQYQIGNSKLSVPLIVGQNWNAGQVTVWNDANYLYVKYDTSSSGWTMKATHLYLGTVPPPTMAPGKFKNYSPSPLPHENLSCVTTDSYQIPLPASWVTGTKIYIAAHAEGCDKETGWAMGTFRKLKIALHLQQVEDPRWKAGKVDYDRDGDIDEDDAQMRWWPTDIFQGDRCIFDMVFWFQQNN